jgi:hypothetical protein
MDDLAEDVVLFTSVLRGAIHGRAAVQRIVKAGGAHYASQTPRFLGSIGERMFLEYDVTLTDGTDAKGLVSISRAGGDSVTELHITFSPVGAVLFIAQGIREHLTAEFDADLFL